MNVNQQFQHIYASRRPDSHIYSHYSPGRFCTKVSFYRGYLKYSLSAGRFPLSPHFGEWQSFRWEELQRTFPQGIISSHDVVPLRLHPPQRAGIALNQQLFFLGDRQQPSGFCLPLDQLFCCFVVNLLLENKNI